LKSHGIAIGLDVGGDPVVARLKIRNESPGRTLSLSRLPRASPASESPQTMTRPRRGNKINQAAEGELVDVEIGINVGVIEFQRSDDQVVG